MPRDPQHLPDLERQMAEVRALLAGVPGRVHLAGIGGVGMAAVALLLQRRGFAIDGCDAAAGEVTAWLQSQGIPLCIGHAAAHLPPDLAWLVRSPAVRDEEAELVAARARGLPIFSRGAVLPALLEGSVSVAVGGSHGKTTTTAMIAHILRHAGWDPSFCVGGVLPDGVGVAAAGSGPHLVVEADESDGTLALYAPDVAVITNVELDHVDYFASQDEVETCFRAFAARARQVVVYGADDPGACRVAAGQPGSLGAGLSAEAQVQAANIAAAARRVMFDVVDRGRDPLRVELPMPGLHNVRNAVVAYAATRHLGVPPDAIARALASFRSVRRRFDILAEASGRMVISDYAHHPTEIRALLQQARGLPYRRIVAVFQPHRFSRTAALRHDFARCFEGVDELVLAPTYAASERPVPGGDLRDLADALAAAGRPGVPCADSLLDAWGLIRNKWRPGDLLLVVGAGDVEKIAFWARDELLRAPAPSSESEPS